MKSTHDHELDSAEARFRAALASVRPETIDQAIRIRTAVEIEYDQGERWMSYGLFFVAFEKDGDGLPKVVSRGMSDLSLSTQHIERALLELVSRAKEFVGPFLDPVDRWTLPHAKRFAIEQGSRASSDGSIDQVKS